MMVGEPKISGIMIKNPIAAELLGMRPTSNKVAGGFLTEPNGNNQSLSYIFV